MFVLGIDGGGSSTVARLADYAGNSIKTVQVGEINSTMMNKDDWIQSCSSILNHFESYVDRIQCIFIGLSGISRLKIETIEFLKEDLKKRIHPDAEVFIVNDAVLGLYAGTGGEDGIVNIAGTGSQTFGLKNGVEFKIGGWGHKFDHTGSGYGIAIEGIKSVITAYENRSPFNYFEKAVMDAWGEDSFMEMMEKINSGSSAKQIAQLSKTICALATEDEQARRIIDRAAHDISDAITRMSEAHFAGEKGVKVILMGGLMNQQDLFLPLLEKKLPHALLKVLDQEPVEGAVIAGLKAVKGSENGD
ncbi:N-acetylglucosamine kinase [Salisediminibacterium selenitireducens]|uniref:ATPase BadF/BadG/BcrA/BcrD type n=1 Tax=Bacillus selenitireducens (strain ATCC 700615 / DSM 15326 / MLS10) TaxID=439292 RepID=D6XVW1_BACIE|nr:BadF/BadG/BcrA/BcrD ATPase family protein [Salisediminibacterium selenitireducens]ADH97734.1 ATPase BadF/BadG/BcrA/BcrD type [[Bacillus] selenitireducens MLS10]